MRVLKVDCIRFGSKNRLYPGSVVGEGRRRRRRCRQSRGRARGGGGGGGQACGGLREAVDGRLGASSRAYFIFGNFSGHAEGERRGLDRIGG